jgi:hypothetical protein
VIVGNSAVAGGGGGVWGAPAMRLCVVAQNSAGDGSGGGGVEITGGNGFLADCCILQNSASNSGPGGISVLSSAQVTRCEIVGNSADFGSGGVQGNATLTSCVILDNETVDPSLSATAGVFGGKLVNDIVRGNLGGFQLGNSQATYCDVEGGFAGTGNFDADPLFVAPASDRHLLAVSPCIDAGDPALLDPDGTRSDVGAYYFRTLYTLANTLPVSWADPAWPEISVRTGGKQALRLLTNNALALSPYILIGSASGTTPGATAQGFHVPLNPDPYMAFTFNFPTARFFGGFRGLLDSDGRADAKIQFGPLPEGLTGVELHHAYGVFDPSGMGVRFVSNAEPLKLAR